jgi:hypothetical protein
VWRKLVKDWKTSWLTPPIHDGKTLRKGVPGQIMPQVIEVLLIIVKALRSHDDARLPRPCNHKSYISQALFALPQPMAQLEENF